MNCLIILIVMMSVVAGVAVFGALWLNAERAQRRHLKTIKYQWPEIRDVVWHERTARRAVPTAEEKW